MTFLQSDQTLRPSESLSPSNQDRAPGSAEPDGQGKSRTSNSHRWLIPVAVVLAIVLGAGIAALSIWRSLPTPHLTIEVFNDTGAPMTDVRFVFAGGRGVRSCEKLANGTTLAWDVTGQSEGFTLAYRQPDGRLVTRPCALALDGDDWGNLTLHVKRSGLKVLTEVEVPSKDSSR